MDVFNSDFSPAGSFTDPTVPSGFAPFGIQNLGGNLIVTFELLNGEKHDEVKGPGHGYVDLFAFRCALAAPNGSLIAIDGL